ncbi:hypothetical protein [Clostridium kluyveri]|uniref:Uncharacterized protein n=1 Tax=Clostridium kluyveri TaxID=1534 RepID=A0A1L5FC52_CLOKL|nr:hypothetical protein [Clostridium kluyveri]APM40585.1 hypothetical protein BS101_18585 [Clostridium kluyveri]
MDKETLSAIKQLLQEELSPIKSQLDENTQILKALEHKVDIVKAEQENMKHNLANISGDIQSIKKDVNILSKDVAFIETATGKNIMDIAYLKSAK